MTKLEQLHLFLKFHFTPWGAAKGEVWETVFDVPYNDVEVEKIVSGVVDGSVGLTEDDIKFLQIVASPPAFATNDVELAMRLTAALTEYEADQEAAHVTADEFLVSLIESLGHPAVAETYRKVNKWSA